MPYNDLIPGQTSVFQLQAIEIVSSLIPKNGNIVEIGALFGRTSYAWSKSVHPSVTVYCIDPWINNKEIKPMEEQYGIKFCIEQWREYTKECSNAIPLQGYSPRDFKKWDKSIDLFFEDSVHRLPDVQENLKHWSSYLKHTGIACGDDFRPRFPDVVNEVYALASRLRRELILVDNFWCLLPQDDILPEVRQVREKLLHLAEKVKMEKLKSPFAHTFTLQNFNEVNGICTFDAYICNDTPFLWTDNYGKNIDAHIVFKVVQRGISENQYSSILISSISEKLFPDLPTVIPVKFLLSDVDKAESTIIAQCVLVDSYGNMYKLLSKQQKNITIHSSHKEQIIPEAYTVHGVEHSKDWETITSLDVHAAYRLLLGRPPETGSELIQRHLDKSKSILELRENFLSSPEFLKNTWPILRKKIATRASSDTECRIDIDITKEQKTRLFKHIQTVWNGLGEKEPHYSVVSHPRFKNSQIDIEDFYATGKSEIDYTWKYLRHLGVILVDIDNAIEWGCGVGRVTKYLAKKFKKVTAFDVSLPHINLAKEHIMSEKINNINFIHIHNLDNIEIPKHSFFYSKLVFQHNPPPITAYILNKILDRLSSGGVGCFQILTDKKNYQFNIDDYISDMSHIDDQELHAFPLKEIFCANNVYPIDVIPGNSIGAFNIEDRMIVCKKK